ncbi:MAG: hypothetical protein RLN99_19050 [Kiloniellaceae bacterium]
MTWRLPRWASAPRVAAAALAMAGSVVLLGAPLVLSPGAAAQSCTTIGSSTFCGPRGSHNTVGNTMIFNNGPSGRRVGDYAVTGTPPRTSVIRGARTSPLSAPRTFAGVGTSKRLGGSGEFYDSRIAALRAEILALEAQHQLEQLDLTPAQAAAKDSMPPALVRALRLAQEAREKDAASGGVKPGGVQ